MPLLRLIAEGVGPFERLDLDLSDGHGNPHLGPHILAGVNGSGKSTALRAIAWALAGFFIDPDQEPKWPHFFSGFEYEWWQHFLLGHRYSRALLGARPPDGDRHLWACFRGDDKNALGPPWSWIDATSQATFSEEFTRGQVWGIGFEWVRKTEDDWLNHRISIGAYAPSRALKHLERLERAEMPNDPYRNCLAFESTVDNVGVQAWLRDLRSRKALAKELGKPSESYERSLDRFQAAIGLVCGEGIRYEVELEPTLQLRLIAFGQSLNFSQLPDGVRNTVGWLADYMMRQDIMAWDPALKGRRTGILLVDEVDAHLHPRWQRTLLPAMRAALPDVQIIVTSHSPFVISSCPGARVHVLELDKQGRAHARPPEDVPLGQSVVATLKDIFEVTSRFDVQTERELEEWNDLLRQEAVGKLSGRDRARLDALTKELSQRSEELRYIVGVRQPPGRNSRSKPSKRRQPVAG